MGVPFKNGETSSDCFAVYTGDAVRKLNRDYADRLEIPCQRKAHTVAGAIVEGER